MLYFEGVEVTEVTPVEVIEASETLVENIEEDDTIGKYYLFIIYMSSSYPRQHKNYQLLFSWNCIQPQTQKDCLQLFHMIKSS